MQKQLLILLVFLLIICLGCGDEPTIQYPGAPFITLEKTAFDGWEEGSRLYYRLRAEEILPYDIEVKVSIRVTYTRYYKGDLEGKFSEMHSEEDTVTYRMKKDRLTYEMNRPTRLYNRTTYYHTGKTTQFITRQYESIELEILPWTGRGSEPYNVGNPSRIEIKRN